MNNDDSVFVNYVFKDPPQPDYIEFGLCYTSENWNDFMRDFGFTSTHDVKAFSSDRLWEMYYKGQAEIYCMLADIVIYLTLSFRLNGNTMIVCDDDDNKYELGEILKTPEQFIEYTQQQCILISPAFANMLSALYNGDKQG